MQISPRLLVYTLILFIPLNSFALVELSLSGNIKNSTLTEKIYYNSVSTTAGFSFYFMEMSAIELSYTLGSNKESFLPTGNDEEDPSIKRTVFESYGLDLILAFADRESVLQPYLKGGVAIIKNEQYLTKPGFTEIKTATAQGSAPSAGVGVRVMLTKALNVKCGIDAWYAPTADKSKKTLDYSGRLGLGWMF